MFFGGDKGRAMVLPSRQRNLGCDCLPNGLMSVLEDSPLLLCHLFIILRNNYMSTYDVPGSVLSVRELK